MTRLAHAAVAAFVVSGSAFAASSANAKDYDGALNWVPADVSSLVAIDLEGARNTAFFRDLQKQIIDLTGYGRDIAQMKREAGLDVMASVKTIVYAGPEEVIRKAKQSLVILEGTFDQAKIKDYYSKKGKLPLTEKTSAIGPYFQIGDDACVAFNGDYAVFGSRALFEKALAARIANQGGKSARVASLVARFKGSKHGFGVITGSATLKKFLGKDFGEVQDVKGAAMGFDFSNGFALKIVGVFSDAGKASTVADAVKKQLVELAADPEIKETGIDAQLSKVVVTPAGNEVKIELTLDATGAAAFAKSLKELF